MDYQKEILALLHARANIGCARCHGPCDAHCSDEDNITPPDTLYPVHPAARPPPAPPAPPASP